MSVVVRVDEAGGIIGGYVTSIDFVTRDPESGSVLESRHYDATQIRPFTALFTNEVFPSAWLEIVPLPFRITGDAKAPTFTVDIDITDYRGNQHHQTLVVPGA